MTDDCKHVTHHARNGIQALMGQMIVLKDRLNVLGVRDQVDLETIDNQIKRIGKAVDKCRPAVKIHDITNKDM